MNDEAFKLNKINIIFIVIDVILFILVVIAFILLSISFGSEAELPNLEVTQGRTSTVNPRTTTTTTTTTTEVTTRKNLNSPYYNVDPTTLLTSELLTKQTLNKEEAMEVMNILYEIGSKIFNTADNSLLDIATTIDYAKGGEIDKIDIDGTFYGIIYNGDALLKKTFSNYFIYMMNDKKINGKSVIRGKNSNYYRMANELNNVELVLVNKSINLVGTSNISASITYYKSNYKEEGYTSPVYKKFTFEAYFEAGRWKLSEFYYPLLD